MNRLPAFLIGPETTLALCSVMVFWFCSRHGSGESRDVVLMERLIWLLPFLLVPVAFATIFSPGAKTWWWLGRAVTSSYAAIFFCGHRIIRGLGSGAKGQDAAFILLIVSGTVAIALASTMGGAIILASTKPGFADWFQAHKMLGSFLTVVTAVPVGFVLGFLVTTGLGWFGGLVAVLKR